MKVKLLSESAIRKKYPDANIASVLLPDDNHIWLPSRIIPFNWQLGGGIPYGKIMEIFGWESSGKSLLAYNFAYCAQQLGGIVLWGDLEGAWTNYWAEQNGLDPTEVEVYENNGIEGMADWARDMIIFYRSKLKNNEPILLVIDSIAAGETEANIGIDMVGAKAEMGNRAKAWDTFYRRRRQLFASLGVCVIMINQVRDKVGATMFESNETTPGGKATRFYSSQRVATFPGKQIRLNGNKKGLKVGKVCTLQVRKNKVAPPRDSLKTEVYFVDDHMGYVGFNKYLGLADILVAKGKIKRKAGRFYRKGKMFVNGEDNFYGEIHTNSKMRKGLIKLSGVNTISKTRDHMATLDNLYPVTTKTTKADEE